MTNGNDLAFTDGYPSRGGLTKRELFAAMAMQGMMLLYTDNRFSPQDIAEWSVIQANLLITELNK